MNAPESVVNAFASAFHNAYGQDEVTILTHARNRVAKLWKADGTVEGFNPEGAKHWTLSTETVSGISGLSTLLDRLSSQERTIVVRGRYAGEVIEAAEAPSAADFKPGLPRRRKYCFPDQPLHAVMFDVDKYEQIVTGDCSIEALEAYIEEVLPEQFHQVSFYYQFSGSAGHPTKPGTNAHIWFWLEEPATSAQLNAWAKELPSRASIDTTVFDTIQPHYTAAPLFEPGTIDPLPNRSGLVRYERDAVRITIPDALLDERVTRKEALQAASANDPIAQALEARGMFKRGQTHDGAYHVVCPFEEMHSSRGSDSSTVFYPAHTGGYATGNFKCLHDHCKDRSQFEFRRELGLEDDAVEFDDQTINSEQSENRVNRFLLASERASLPIKPDLIKGVIPDASFGIIYGQSGAGKSFAALDLGYHLAMGRPWRGRKVKHRKVFYVAAEGAEGVRKRTKAYCDFHGVPADTPFFTCEKSFDLFTAKAWVGAAMDIRALLEPDEAGVIVVDTLSRSIPGVDENSAKDMSQVINNCEKFARATNCLVIVVAHAGKDESKGARGSTALRAAADFEISVTRNDDTNCRKLTLTKEKDAPDGSEFFFTLQSVAVGADTDGEEVYSAVVVPMDAQDVPRVEKLPSGKQQRIALAACKSLAMFAENDGVTVDAVIDKVYNETIDPQKNTRSNAKRAIEDLVRDGYLTRQRERLYLMSAAQAAHELSTDVSAALG